MGKNIFKIYTLVAALCLGLLVFVYTQFTTVEFLKNQHRIPVEVTDLQVSQDANNMTLSGIIPDNIKQDDTYGFYTSHKSVKFYIDNELYYSFDRGNNLFGNTAGNAWHFVNVTSEESGKEYYIELKTPYESESIEVPKVFFGEEYQIFISIIANEIIEIIICFLIGIIGIVLITFWLVMKKKAEINKGLLYLGTFSTILSIWSFNELSVSALLFKNNLITSNISYIMLMLMVIPFVLFTRDFFANSKGHFWNVICCLSLINIVVCIYLQVFKNIDLKLTLWTTHVLLILFVIFQIYLIIKELVKRNITAKMKINIVGSVIVLFGLVMDLYFYYIKKSYDANVFGRVCYLIYIMMLAVALLKEADEFIKKAREFDIYEKLAFTDILTGMKNRTKFSKDISLYTNNEDVKVVMLDLNDLKKYNDTMGHEIGDYYIKTSANIITNTFEQYGDCYRIGGDEFCVVITENSSEAITSLISKLREEELKHNSTNDTVKVQIACGFAEYNKDIDTNIDDVLRRADFAMYYNKKEIKK